MMKLQSNKGQVLVLFVIMVPIIFFLVAFFLENMIITGNKNKLDNLNQLISKYAYENRDNIGLYDGILDLILKNDRNVFITEFNVTDKKIDITLSKNTNSIFGKIIGIDAYEINSSYDVIIDDEDVIYNRK